MTSVLKVSALKFFSLDLFSILICIENYNIFYSKILPDEEALKCWHYRPFLGIYPNLGYNLKFKTDLCIKKFITTPFIRK